VSANPFDLIAALSDPPSYRSCSLSLSLSLSLCLVGRRPRHCYCPDGLVVGVSDSSFQAVVLIWSFARNLEQVANLLRGLVNSAPYPQRAIKWVP